MIVVHQVLLNLSEPLVTAMAPLFSHDDNNSCLEAGQAGSDIKCWWELLICVGGRSMFMMHSQWRVSSRLIIQIEIRAFCEKNIGFMIAGWIGALSVEMSHNIRICMMHSFEWDMLESIPHYNADLWNLPAWMTHTILLSQNKMQCSS
jgi:hypothetical protein